MDNTARIRELNDAFRTTFVGGRIVVTTGVQTLDDAERKKLLDQVRSFAEFNGDNDPHREHDFGSIDLVGQKFFWKIDYYDAALQFGSEDPTDPTKTTRVLTIMLAEEY